MKKTLCLLLAGLLLLSVFVGCSKQETPVVSDSTVVSDSSEPVAEPEPEPVVPKVLEDGRDRPSNAGRLQVLDGKLCSESGEPVMLRGVSSYGISVAESFINEQLFEEISRDMGVNVFRLALYTSGTGVFGYCTGGDKERLNNDMYMGVEYAKNNDMYAIIDWHILGDYDPHIHMDDAKVFFADMAERYCDYNNVLYEICNEPNGEADWETIKDYANVIIPIIRERDPDSVIIVGTPDYSSKIEFPMKDPLDYDNLMYTYHFYAASVKDEGRKYLKKVSQSGLPIFVTEYGITANTGGHPRDPESADKWIDLLEEENISYCLWSFSKVPEACSVIRSNVPKYCGFEESDYSETGLWLIETLKNHGGNNDE